MENIGFPKTLTVAVVDDDPAVRILLKEILSPYNVLIAENYSQLREILSGHRPDLLFLDINLPDANGIDICSQLRHTDKYRDMVIFLITALADDSIVEQGYACGADDFIRKPFHHFEIRAKTAIFERIIQSTSALNDANRTLAEKNRKFHSFGRFIQAGLNVMNWDESLATAETLQDIIRADFCEVIRMNPDGPVRSYVRSLVGESEIPGFMELSAKLDLTKPGHIYFAAIRGKNGSHHIAMITVRHMNTVFAYVMFQKKLPFNEDDREILTMYGEFLNILSERSVAEEELQRKNREYKSEINRIRTIQVSLMPQFKEITGLDIASSYLPAKDLSGDFIDAFFLNDDLYQIILCDVSGHGIAASYVGNEFRTLFRTLSRHDRSPGKTAAMVNEAAVRDLNNLYYFCTAIILQIRMSTGEIEFTIAGHPGPILVTDSSFTMIPQNGPLIGLFGGMEYRDEKILLGKGECFFLYTDGITEAADTRGHDKGEMFGAERLCGLVSENRGYSSTDILHFVISSVYEFTDYQDQGDDISAVCIKGR